MALSLEEQFILEESVLTEHCLSPLSLEGRLLSDDDDVRQRACEAVGALGSVAEPCVRAVAECLVDENDEVRKAACEALGNLGADLTRSYTGAVADCLMDEDEDVRQA